MAPKDTEGVEKAHDQEIAKESASLKRAREGSHEPTPSPNPVTIAPTKKNRLASTSEEQPTLIQAQELTKESSNGSDVETGKVGEVRRKVQEMTWKEGQSRGQGKGEGEQEWEEEVIKEEEVKEAKENAKENTQEEGSGNGSEVGVKRKSLDRNDSSILEKADSAKKTRDTPSPPSESAAAKPVEAAEPPATSTPTTQAPAKKPPTTFGSFSSASSPFATARPAGSSPSPFASASASASASGPSSSKPPTGSGFGNYTFSPFSAFAKKTPVVPSSSTTGQGKEGEGEGKGSGKDGEESKAGPSKSSTFGDILKESKADEGEVEDKVQMTEKDVYTGEEGEEMIFQCRCKLYVMQADGGWKERGVGALRLNHREGKAPRLVMRAEGVLRLILNVSLYVGMACLEDGKHVRATVFEDGEKKFITFRFSTAKGAAELCSNIQEHIPLESSKSPAGGAPSPSGGAGGWARG